MAEEREGRMRLLMKDCWEAADITAHLENLQKLVRLGQGFSTSKLFIFLFGEFLAVYSVDCTAVP